MILKSINFVHGMFRDYYKKDKFLNIPLSMVDKREFGFISFEGRMIRHKGFKNNEELATFLENFVPRDAYLSCAYYDDPQAEMERKGWLGADLIFDIDADHIPTLCGKSHDHWICSSCGFSGEGNTPATCPHCGGEKFAVHTWPCEVCLASAKTETVKLLDMLTQDFGFSDREIQVFFSGHRGYHVQIESETIRTLDSTARKEIVDYVYGLGLDVSFVSSSRDKNSFFKSAFLGDFGWSKRLTQGIRGLLIAAKEEDFANVGLTKNVVDIILRNRDKMLENLANPTMQSRVKGVGPETWARIAEHVVKLQSAKVDTVVTTDTHRLIRLVCTLHNKTGFKKVAFPVSHIHDFDPFNEAVAFKGGTETVKVSNAPEFRLGDEMFGPYRNQTVELPTAVAMLLVCKDRAEVID